jgi:hypothetical protein
MKAGLAVLFLSLVSAIAVVPAFADPALYSNGSSTYNNGDSPNIGFEVTDSFTLPSNSVVTGVTFDVWLSSEDTLSTVDWSIGTSQYGGTPVTAGTTGTFIKTNGDEFDVYSESFSIPSLAFGPGTYWLTLQNAVTVSGDDANGDDAFWDESNGPSLASRNIVGNVRSIPSETFQILGTQGTTVTPEPSSFLLLGSGLAALAGLLKRKLKA